MNPNIYTFANTEYAQDAFIAWLCSCYNQTANPFKQQIAGRFIKELLGINVTFNNIHVETQVKNIDILLSLDNGKYYVVIEDKKFSNIHDDQLHRYVDSLLKKGEQESQIFVVYYKTGHISCTPNYIYFRKPHYYYNTDIKSEKDKVKEILSSYPHLAGLSICDLQSIHNFFQSVSSLIKSSGSEILEDYADNIKDQYQKYTSVSIDAKKGRKEEIWGKIFDDFIVTAKHKFPNLSFKLDFYTGNYWEIYITGPTPQTKGEHQYSEPILNIRSDIFEGKTKRIFFFFFDKLVNTESLEVHKMSASYVLPIGMFKNQKLNKANYQGPSVDIADINLLLDAICEEFDSFVIKHSVKTFEL